MARENSRAKKPGDLVEIDLLKMQRNRVQMRSGKIVLTVMTPMLNQLPVRVFQVHREKSTL
jgi:hypothetical protein